MAPGLIPLSALPILRDGRPPTISELAEEALEELEWDENRDLKQTLRITEKTWKEARELHQSGRLEKAFVVLARAATLILEKIPTHKHYSTLLNSTQRHNLALVSSSISLRMYELLIYYPLDSCRMGKTS